METSLLIFECFLGMGCRQLLETVNAASVAYGVAHAYMPQITTWPTVEADGIWLRQRV